MGHTVFLRNERKEKSGRPKEMTQLRKNKGEARHRAQFRECMAATAQDNCWWSKSKQLGDQRGAESQHATPRLNHSCRTKVIALTSG